MIRLHGMKVSNLTAGGLVDVPKHKVCGTVRKGLLREVSRSHSTQLRFFFEEGQNFNQ